MFYKMRENVLFRKYRGHGYITDHAEYGYRMLNDRHHSPGERYVSASRAVMLSMLTKSPRSFDDIVKELSQIFHGVDYDTLKQDTMEFLDLFVKEGFLVCGETFDNCRDQSAGEVQDPGRDNVVQDGYASDDCAGGEISPDDYLRRIHFDIADACNERCIHCYIPNKDSFADVLHWGWEHHMAVVTQPVIFAAYDHSCANLRNHSKYGPATTEDRAALQRLQAVCCRWFYHSYSG